MRKTLSILGLSAVILIFILTFAFTAFKNHKMKQYFSQQHIPVMTVAAARAAAINWHPYLSSVGTVVAINQVEITPRLAGQVEKILFHSGDEAKKGQVLVALDDGLYQQQLRMDLAVLYNAKQDYKRKFAVYKKTGAYPLSELDAALSSIKQYQAIVAKDKLNIEYMKIKAPFSGTLGIRQANIGQYLQLGNPVVSLQSLNPIYVDFSMPDQDSVSLQLNQVVKLSTASYPNRSFFGKIVAISPQISSDTRTLSLRAMFINKDKRLLPGQFVQLKVLLPTQKKVIVVPLTAVSYSLYGDSIFVLRKQMVNKKTALVANQVPVTLGQRRGNQVIVKSGIKANDQVVISGQLKLHNGSLVKVNNSISMQKAGA